jgi:hypothetical protein
MFWMTIGGSFEAVAVTVTRSVIDTALGDWVGRAGAEVLTVAPMRYMLSRREKLPAYTPGATKIQITFVAYGAPGREVMYPIAFVMVAKGAVTEPTTPGPSEPSGDT